MITALKVFLKTLLVPFLYFGGIWAIFMSAFRNREYGLFVLLFLVCQPNIYYKFHDYPLGWKFLDFLILSLLVGSFIQNSEKTNTENKKWIILLIMINYIAIWNTSFNFDLPSPIFTNSYLFVDWKNYIRAFLLYFFAYSIATNEDKQKIIVLIIALAILLISVRAFRNFSGGSSFHWDKRVGGPFEAMGLGANHFGAFIAAYASMLFGMFFNDNNKYRKILYLSAFLFSLHPLFFSYSRGAYLAVSMVLLFISLVKKRTLFVVLICVGIFWKTLLPESVVDRITMTQTEEGTLENSSAGRLELWNRALFLFKQNPVIGSGYNSFTISMASSHNKIISANIELTDSHNFYVKILCEQGIIGFGILLMVFSKAFFSGFRLYKNAKTPFNSGLGFGFMCCMIALIVVNIFGDRFSYIVSNAYFWAFWGLVDRGISISNESGNSEDSTEIKSGYLQKLIHP